MARYKKFIDANVLDEAKRRIHHIYDVHDAVIVSFSGGKDSLAVLHLVKEVAQERGIKKVDAVFRDEELIPQVIVDFVKTYHDADWLNLRWLAVPLESHKYVLGQTSDYIQWDPNRKWVREKPSWALTNKDLGYGEDKVWDQYSMDDQVASWFKGKVGITIGLRAAESLIRFRSCVNKLNENYIVGSLSSKRATLTRPIFDWQENDVFKYFYEEKINYCAIYDRQGWAGQAMRVSTPIHAEAAKRFDFLRRVDPDLYDRVVEVFPEMLVQERYWSEFDRTKDIAAYGQSFEGIRTWILENIDDEGQQRKAMLELRSVMIRAKGNPQSYPTEYVLKAMMGGAYKRVIQPLKPR